MDDFVVSIYKVYDQLYFARVGMEKREGRALIRHVVCYIINDIFAGFTMGMRGYLCILCNLYLRSGCWRIYG